MDRVQANLGFSGRAEWLDALAAETGVFRDRCTVLPGRCGSHARLRRGGARRWPKRRGAGRVHAAEIGLLCSSDRISRLEDVVLRRTREKVAEVMTAELDWDSDHRDREMSDTAALLKRQHGVST